MVEKQPSYGEIVVKRSGIEAVYNVDSGKNCFQSINYLKRANTLSGEANMSELICLPS